MGKKILKYAGRVLVVVTSVILVLALTLMGAIYMISKGKAESVKEMFVVAMCETGAMDFCARMFLTNEEVDAIIEKTQIIVPEGETNTSLIVISGEDSEDSPTIKEQETADGKLGIKYNDDGVCLLDIKGKTYVGKVLVVKDPKRVQLAALDSYGENVVGKTTEQMAKDLNALAAINAGGYEERSDYRTGGQPAGCDGESGLVIDNGVLKYGSKDATYNIIGFDGNGILHVDKMTAGKALESGILDAVNWTPALVKNGEPCIVNTASTNPGFHPRSAIGQRADGSVVLLVIDGRQAHSMGASYEDLVEVMMRYGCVNAANLDGGMSSYMVYDNEVITKPYMLYFNGRRTVSTSFIVTRKN